MVSYIKELQINASKDNKINDEVDKGKDDEGDNCQNDGEGRVRDKIGASRKRRERV